MSYTEYTANLKLPQWIETDYPSWLTDVNSAFLGIDNKSSEVDAKVQLAIANAASAQNAADESSNKVTTLDGVVNGLKSDVESVTVTANAASETASNANVTAESASNTATRALNVANSASETANTAKNTADSASDKASSALSSVSNIFTDATGFYHMLSSSNAGHITFDNSNVDIKADDNLTGIDVTSDGDLNVYNSSGSSVFSTTNILSRVVALENTEKFSVTLDFITLGFVTSSSETPYNNTFSCFDCGNFMVGVIINGTSLYNQYKYTSITLSKEINYNNIKICVANHDYPHSFDKNGITGTISGTSINITTNLYGGNFNPLWFVCY